MTLLHVLAGVVALLLGVYLGMPGKYERRRRGSRGFRLHGRSESGVHDPKHLAELEGSLARDDGRTKTAKRHFTLLDGLARAKGRASRRRRGAQSRFRTVAPSPSVSSKEDRSPPAKSR